MTILKKLARPLAFAAVLCAPVAAAWLIWGDTIRRVVEIAVKSVVKG